MRRILEKRSKYAKNKNGQVMIINIVMMVMAILVFMAVLPVVKEQLDTARNYDVLNCKDLTRECGTDTNEVPCYNSSYSKSETVGCAMMDLYVPYIVIIVLLAGAAKLMANRMDTMFASQPTYG